MGGFNPNFGAATRSTLLDNIIDTAKISQEHLCYSHSDGLFLLIMYGGWTPILFFVNCLTFILAKPMVLLAWIGSWRHNVNASIVTKLIYDICNLLTLCVIIPVFAFFILSPLSHFWFGWTSTSFYKFPQGTLFWGIFNAIFSFGFLVNFSDIISQMNF